MSVKTSMSDPVNAANAGRPPVIITTLTGGASALPSNPSVAQNWAAASLHAEADHVLLWFTKGQGQLNIGGINRVFAPNTVLFIPAGTVFSYDLRAGVFGSMIKMRADVGITVPDLPLHLRSRDLVVQASLVAVVEGLQRELRLDQPFAEQASIHHANLLGVWLARQALVQQERHKLDAAERLVSRYAALIGVRFASGDNVADYAATLGVTPTHLTRVCRKCGGRSALQMLQDRILHEARALLCDTDKPVKKIAQDLGYRSAAYFTRSFQAHVGQTPSRFRADNLATRPMAASGAVSDTRGGRG